MTIICDPLTVIALDPGGTTGWAVGRIEDGSFDLCENSQARLTTDGLYGLLDAVSPTHVVTEDFTFRQGSNSGLLLVSRDLMGVSQLWCSIHHRDFSVQPAGLGKPFFTNARLRQIEMYRPGEAHARDALRHLLVFAVFREGTRYLSVHERRRLLGADVKEVAPPEGRGH